MLLFSGEKEIEERRRYYGGRFLLIYDYSTGQPDTIPV